MTPFKKTRSKTLIRFKSRATGDLIMLKADGMQVLEIIGKHAGPQGIVLPDEMDAAIEKLRAAIERAEARPAPKPASARKPGETDGFGDPIVERDITLRQRAMPFINMLRECKAAGVEVVWGV